MKRKIAKPRKLLPHRQQPVTNFTQKGTRFIKPTRGSNRPIGT